MGNTTKEKPITNRKSHHYKIQTVYVATQTKKFIEQQSQKLEIKCCHYLRGLMQKYHDWVSQIPDMNPVYLNLNVKKAILNDSKKFYSFSDYIRSLLLLEMTQKNLDPVYPLVEDLSKDQIFEQFNIIFHKMTNTEINSPVLIECNGLKYQIRKGKFVCIGGEKTDYIPKGVEYEQRVSELSGEN